MSKLKSVPCGRRGQSANISLRRLLRGGGLLLIFTPTLASAADPDAFSLSISHSRAEWQYPADTQATTLTRWELRLTEPLARRINGTLRLMYLDLSQPDNPLPEMRNASGEGVGVSVQVSLLEGERLEMNWQLAYAYQALTNQFGSKVAELVWHNWRSGLALTLFPDRAVSLLAGASLDRIDGEQRSTGTLNQVLSFNESQRDSYYTGIRLRTDFGGSIELKAYTGAWKSLQLVLRRQF